MPNRELPGSPIVLPSEHGVGDVAVATMHTLSVPGAGIDADTAARRELTRDNQAQQERLEALSPILERRDVRANRLYVSLLAKT